MTKTGLNCKTSDGVCAERQQGSYGACRLCEFSTMKRTVEVAVSMRDYQFVKELCEKDGTPIDQAVTQLVYQGIRSLQRHV
jgi:hypothetical protein